MGVTRPTRRPIGVPRSNAAMFSSYGILSDLSTSRLRLLPRPSFDMLATVGAGRRLSGRDVRPFSAPSRDHLEATALAAKFNFHQASPTGPGLRPAHRQVYSQLAGIPTKDLYSLISKCDDAQRRGFPWSAIFWKEIKPAKL